MAGSIGAAAFLLIVILLFFYRIRRKRRSRISRGFSNLSTASQGRPTSLESHSFTIPSTMSEHGQHTQTRPTSNISQLANDPAARPDPLSERSMLLPFPSTLDRTTVPPLAQEDTTHLKVPHNTDNAAQTTSDHNSQKLAPIVENPFADPLDDLEPIHCDIPTLTPTTPLIKVMDQRPGSGKRLSVISMSAASVSSSQVCPIP